MEKFKDFKFQLLKLERIQSVDISILNYTGCNCVLTFQSDKYLVVRQLTTGHGRPRR